MKIVIIDDLQINVTLLQHLVKKLPGCTSICFTDPLAALDWCMSNEPDLIIIDYMMPKMSGVEFVERFRVRYATIPILMVTANHETELRHHALQMGVTDFLNKPLNNVEFLARTKNMLALRESHNKLANHAVWLAEEVRKATEELVTREQETILCLAAAAEHRDPETGMHIQRMAQYSRHIARMLKLSAEDQELILNASPMHDIGKVGTPDIILLKPGKLNPEEFTIMKQHALIGYKVLSTSNSPLLQVAAEIALSHHEKFDGSGYPKGLKGEQIPLFGRIVAIADVFDALTSERPYKKAWTVKDAFDFLQKNSGLHFDPKCIDAFFADIDTILAIKSKFAEEPDGKHAG